MYIKKIKLNNFRNYSEQEIELNNEINVFFGQNAQGKTNIVESIFICSLGKSFRTNKEKELIKFNENNTRIEMEYEKKDRNGKINYNIGDKKEILIKLPGVGGKTANVFLSEYYNYPFIAVDTHVERVSKRLGLAYKNDNVIKV